MLIKGRTLALLVRSGDKLVSLVLKPFPQAELILGSAEKFGDVLGVLTALFPVNAGPIEISTGREQNSHHRELQEL
jgi:hypothetical protein